MPKIEEKTDGPLAVHDADGIVDCDGAKSKADSPMFLCRCGRSNDKPFCDGTHVKAGFSSRTENEPSGDDTIKRYSGESYTVLYNPRICAHAAECLKLAPEAFDPGAKPWIRPGEAAESKVREAVSACPSGALRIEDEPHDVPERATIRVQRDGPYWVTGATIDGTTPGAGSSEHKYTLCRCGLSGSKPYCDGTHYDQNWRSGD